MAVQDFALKLFLGARTSNSKKDLKLGYMCCVLAVFGVFCCALMVLLLNLRNSLQHNNETQSKLPFLLLYPFVSLSLSLSLCVCVCVCSCVSDFISLFLWLSVSLSLMLKERSFLLTLLVHQHMEFLKHLQLSHELVTSLSPCPPLAFYISLSFLSLHRWI